MTVESLPPRHQSPMKNSSNKKLGIFGDYIFLRRPYANGESPLRSVGSARLYDTPNATKGTSNNETGRNLFQEFPIEPVSEHVSPLSEFGISVMKTIQSIVQGRHTHTAGYEADKENTPGNTLTCTHAKIISDTNSDTEQLWEDTFLQKSSSFLKAVRKSGRRGKVLIQGWVVFREPGVSWKEIIRSPKRCDFRYIVLLDDLPLLHIFSPRPKQKKLMPKHDFLQDCLSLDLMGDITTKVELASKEFGNEICIVDDETNQRLCSLLPIPMPQSIFLDKHQSRLAKGEALKKVFVPFKRCVTFASRDRVKPPELPAIMEQYDVARHILFVLDCAIKFPLNTGSQRRSSLEPDLASV